MLRANPRILCKVFFYMFLRAMFVLIVNPCNLGVLFKI